MTGRTPIPELLQLPSYLYYESERLFKRNLRNYFMSLDSDYLKYNSNLGIKKDVKICTVTEDVPTVAIKD